MTMENPPFADVFPLEHGDFPMSCYSFQGSIRFLHPKSPQAFEAVCAATMAVCKSFAPKDARPTSLPEGPMNTGPH